MEGKPVSFSALRDQTAIVFPNDLNAFGTLFGGRILELADRCAGIVAKRHTGRVCVTLGIDSVRFHAPANRGDILVLQASLNKVWRTSMEIGLKVWAEDNLTQQRSHIFSAYFTFVALDEEMKPVQVPSVIPETKDEKRRFAEAEERRNHRLNSLA